jgi:hypothetical protein
VQVPPAVQLHVLPVQVQLPEHAAVTMPPASPPSSLPVSELASFPQPFASATVRSVVTEHNTRAT